MSDTNIPEVEALGDSRFGRAMQTILSVVLVGTSLLWCADLFRPLGINFFPEQLASGCLAISLGILYLRYPAQQGTKRTHLPFYDIVLSFVGLGAGMYIAINFPDLQTRLVDKPFDAVLACAIVMLLCLEGLRRTVGWALLLVVLAAIGYAMVGHHISGPLETRRVDTDRLLLYLNLDTSAVLGDAMQIGATVVLAFCFFGALLSRSGASTFFNDIAVALFGRSRGGPAKVAVVASSLFGMISGLAVANIMATGIVTIPMMKKAGFPPHHAGAVEASAATGGQLMPPVMGAVAFVMADFLEMSYGAVCIAAAIPALLYYAALFIQADLDAARWGFGRVEESEIPQLNQVLKAGSIFIIPFAALLGTLFFLNWEAQLSAIAASVCVIAVGLLKGYGGHRMNLMGVWKALVETGFGIIDIVMVVAGAGFIMGVFQVTGLGFALTALMVDIGGGNLWVLLLLAAALSTVLGMGLPTLSVYVLVAVLFAPALVQTGISPLAAHMFLLYFGMMSMITPPVALAAFFAANLSGANAMRTGFSAMRFSWTAFVVPFLFVLSPPLLLQGPLIDIVIAVPLAILGVFFVSAALSGCIFRNLSTLERLVFGVAGITIMLPQNLAAWAIWANLLGLAICLPLALRQWALRRSASAATI